MKIALCVAVCLTVVLFSQESSAGTFDEARNEAEKLLGDAKKLHKDLTTNAKKQSKVVLSKLKQRLEKLNSRINGWFNNKPPGFIKTVNDLISRELHNIESRIDKA